jgi:hypothetical protein
MTVTVVVVKVWIVSTGSMDMFSAGVSKALSLCGVTEGESGTGREGRREGVEERERREGRRMQGER